MKRYALVVLAVVGLGLLAWRRVFSHETLVAYHQREWHLSWTRHATGAPVPFLRARLFNERPWSFWMKEKRRHESELLRLGYLTNSELRLTNQVMTPAFLSNFFWQIRTQLGTNYDQVWIANAVSNKAGFNPLLPAKDVATWERIFRECAVRYASNLPPALAANTPPQ